MTPTSLPTLFIGRLEHVHVTPHETYLALHDIQRGSFLPILPTTEQAKAKLLRCDEGRLIGLHGEVVFDKDAESLVVNFDEVYDGGVTVHKPTTDPTESPAA